jgi:L-fuculose-phosphate aldolase
VDAGAARKDLVTFGQRLYEKGFVASTDGNLSARLPGGGFLTTPTGLPKGELSEDLIASLDGEGRAMSGKPSSEWPMHMAVYRARPDIGAVVHAHPPFATALACAGRGIDRPVLSEVVISLGTVPLAPFELPSTEDLAEGVAGALGEHAAVLLANHGAVTVGPDVRTAYYRMETLEQAARITLYADLLGGGRPLPEPAVQALKTLGEGYRLAPLPSPACEGCPVAAGERGALVLRRDELARLLAEFARVYPGGKSQ